MKRTTLTASLVGSAAAGLIAAAIATPAWSQATTYPEGTDCSAIQNSANRTDCMNQMNESRQKPAPGSSEQGPNATTPQPGIQPAPGNAPAGTNDATGSGNSSGTGTGGSQPGTVQ